LAWFVGWIRTTSDDAQPGKAVFYPHAYPKRIKIYLDKAAAEDALGRCSWSPTVNEKAWKNYTPRGVGRGGASPTDRELYSK
jgi:hypothetical protein